jgi:anti-sigma factor RsiW
VSDGATQLSSEEMAELCALADGTLPDDRRAEIEARVTASPELQELLERQRSAVSAAQVLSDEEVPASLRAAVQASRRELGSKRERGRRLMPRLAVAAAAVAVVLVIGAILLTSGPGAPTVADAAQLATQAPTAPAPAVGRVATKLAVGVDSVAFPNLDRYGWQALGVRRGRVGGRDATVVVYGKDGRRLGYVIVAGKALSRPAEAQAKYISRVQYQTLPVNGRLAVTWRRGGHTCVLLGQASRAELLKLASWPLTPPR